MHVVPPLPQSYASFEQQSTNLVDDCRATHHPTLAHAMQGLHIQLVMSLDRHETHRRPCDSLSDRLGTLRSYPGFPHGMPTTHADQINADLLEFIKREASVAAVAAV